MRLYSTPSASLGFDQLEIDLPSKDRGRVYLTWQPVEAKIRMLVADGKDREATVTNANEDSGGQVRFGTSREGTEDKSLTLKLPGDGTWRTFWLAGQTASTEDGDGAIAVRTTTVPEIKATVPLMVRVRKDAEALTPKERDRFLWALGRLNDSGKGVFGTFRTMHMPGMEDEAHKYSAFLPWHRAYILDFERELQLLDASVTLPYWRFDKPAPRLFSRAFLGESRLLGKRVRFRPGHPLLLWKTDQQLGIFRRPVAWDTGTETPDVITEAATLNLGILFRDFRLMESQPHGHAHTAWTGSLPDTGAAPRDPLFFMLHSNVDRLWAKWQKLAEVVHTDPGQTAGYDTFGNDRTTKDDDAAAPRIGHQVGDTMWPWNGDMTHPRPQFAPGGGLAASPITNAPAAVPTVGEMLDYQGFHTFTHFGFDYDEIPFRTGIE